MPAYRVPEHIWRTRDGRLVRNGDPDAAVLAYARGDEMAEDEARRRGIIAAVTGGQAKDRTPKQVAKPGLTVTKKENTDA